MSSFSPSPHRTLGFAVLVVLLSAVGCSRQSALPAASANPDQSLPFSQAQGDSSGISPTASLTPEAIPIGTSITIRLQSSLSSASAHSGETFDAVLDEPIVIQGQTLAHSGAAVIGRVVAAKASGRLQDPGYLRLALSSIDILGKPQPVQSSSVFVKGGSHEKRNLAFIGGGAGGGALIGGIAGGGKGALIGSAVGAASGTGAAYVTGKKDVGFSAEQKLTFRLTEPLLIRD